MCEVGELRARAPIVDGERDRADRHRDLEIAPRPARPVRALAVRAALGLELGVIAELDERVELRVDDQMN